ncbi:MAG: DUF1697 domain-containing protein [Flavobacteriaceae bacterium]|jgi:uncharacterized protein (DUF1697 family)|nr:DUF1697 domain-containing protein [Flavobacteriaceae bacterium]
MVYIALLRGINVSGQKIIKMTDLKALCETLGYTDVQTYIQSGNIVFRSSPTTTTLLKEQLQNAIKEKFGFDVPICLYTLTDFTAILQQNTLYAQEKENQLYLTYLNEGADFTLQADIESKMNEGDQLIFTPQAVYIYVPQGYGKTKLTNTFIETKLKTEATTRNWKTSNKLVEIGQQLL